MRIHDISRPVAPGIPVWPGDTEYAFNLGWDMAAGASANVGSVTMSVHTGTHTDAPFHFAPDGAGVGELALSAYIGPAFVVEAVGQSVIGREAFDGLDLSSVPRVLVKTGAWRNGAPFPSSVPTLALDVPAYLAECGVVLVGVDVPSVDAIESQDLPIHHALTAGDIRIVESLDLSAVAPGVYTLVALPLRLVGADASPVRAILIEESHAGV